VQGYSSLINQSNLREKHYPPPENMLNVFIIQTTRGHIIDSLVAGSILVENLQYSD
jgi:hypothetical protein